ncbi:NADH-cytochrome b5 reductase 1 [Wickerhamomyces ciferrii]|uniref:NADH-cytochrome b5 reductase n=1 Tax=Wickerhamomyces ciferrii (strain ATCC 14091 / BCRC 22168 / CBS 111 / JCM 3599 / NBRC 0793 / NRRL Y-1031 F-60-10) TaxID=1206466 RepID=K0KJA7_WICCF|nr:NADH-cytochrome b5 reductase 1 [Wickerhamomyces ciferrii]CCH41574.1 NADH-cytochrome b5 reductase 1 [Wickerhamomyces ciferrii]
MSLPIVPIAIGVVLIIITSVFFLISSKRAPVLNKDEFKKFPLIQKTILSHNSGIYRFALPNPDDILGLPIGQHISIKAEINGKEIVRSYTPTSNDAEKGYFDLLIKSYPTGNISKYIAELSIGDSIDVRGPKGFFEYVPNQVTHFGMVAGGTGITPMYQIINAIINNPADKTQVQLIYGNQTEADILLKKELDDIVAKHPQIKVHYMLDRPSDNWTGGVGFVTPEILEQYTPKVTPKTQLLLCGPPPMVNSIKKAAVNLGYTKAKPVSKSGDQIFVF